MDGISADVSGDDLFVNALVIAPCPATAATRVSRQIGATTDSVGDLGFQVAPDWPVRPPYAHDLPEERRVGKASLK